MSNPQLRSRCCLALLLFIAISGVSGQDIIINELFVGTNVNSSLGSSGDGWVEVVLLDDLSIARLEAFYIGDSTVSGASKWSAYRFQNMASLLPTGVNRFQAGSVIAIGGGAAFAGGEDTAYDPGSGDWNLRLRSTGSHLIELNLQTGDFDPADVVYVDNSLSSTNQSLQDGFSGAWGGGAGMFASNATVQFASSPDVFSPRVSFMGSVADITSPALWMTTTGAGTPGTPNDVGGLNDISIIAQQVLEPPYQVADTSLEFGLLDTADDPTTESAFVEIFSDDLQLAFAGISGGGATSFQYAGSSPLTFTGDTTVNLPFTFLPQVDDGSTFGATATFTATGDTIEPLVLSLAGQSYRSVPLSQARSEYEAGSFTGLHYKISGWITANNHDVNDRVFSMQSEMVGSSATRGITVFDPTSTWVTSGLIPMLGEPVTVYGTLDNERGLVRLLPNRAVVSMGSPVAITPRTILATELADATEGVLIELTGVNRPAGSYMIGNSYSFSTPSGVLPVFIPVATGINSTYHTPTTVNMIGVGHQETTSTTAHPLSGGDGYRLLPRSENDLPVTISRFVIE